MNLRLFLCACLLSCGVFQASSSPIVSTLGLPDSAKMRIGRGTVNSVDYSPDGKRIAAASTIGVWIYDALYGGEIALLQGHTDSVLSASYSPDGTKIVSAGWDKTVRLWDAETGALLKTLEGHTDAIFSAAFSLDGKNVVSASGDKTVSLWDAETGAILKMLEGHTAPVASAAFSPDGKNVVSASWDKTVRIWDVETGALLKTLEGHSVHAYSAEYSQDGAIIVSTGWDRNIRIWDAQTWQILRTLPEPFSVVSAQLSLDGTRLVSGGYQGLTLWNVENGSEMAKIDEDASASSISFSPDGHFVAGAMSANLMFFGAREEHDQNAGLRIWNIKIRALARSFEGHTHIIGNAVFSPDNKRLAVGFHEKIQIWDADAGALLNEFESSSPFNPPYSWASYSPDGKRLAAVKRDEIAILDAETGATRVALKGHTDDVHSAVYSPDGMSIVSVGKDGTIRIWNAETGALHKTLAGDWGSELIEGRIRVALASFSPDSKRIVSDGSDMAWIWDAETGERLRMLKLYTGNLADLEFLDIKYTGVESTTYSPDGKTIIGCSRSSIGVITTGCGSSYRPNYNTDVLIWDAETGDLLKALKGHAVRVQSAVYSPDGKTIVSGGEDNTIRIWNAETGALLKTLEGHTRGVQSAAYSPDGKTIMSVGGDDTVLLWDVSDL